jgi:Fe-S cluster assembly iron-binding protein IscA
VEVTKEAREKLLEFLEDYGDGGFVRVARLVTGGGCCANIRLGASLDEDHDEEKDMLFTLEGLPVVIEKSVHAAFSEIRIAFDENDGIVVSSGGPAAVK